MDEMREIQMTAAICENGHIISGDISKNKVPSYCVKCGSKVLTKCPNCGKDILGDIYCEYYSYGVPSRTMKHIITQKNLPLFCEKCGARYPWGDKGRDDSLLPLGIKNPVVKIGNVGNNSRVNIGSYDESINVEDKKEEIIRAIDGIQRADENGVRSSKKKYSKLLLWILGISADIVTIMPTIQQLMQVLPSFLL